MHYLDLTRLNYLAVAAAALAAFFIGAIWYTVLLGKLWMVWNSGSRKPQISDLEKGRFW
jgi:hypothetical protein